MNLTFTPATPSNVYYVALQMRARDLAEFSAMTYDDDRVSAAIRLAALYGDMPGVECAMLDGVPVAVGGLVWARPGVASLLFYATDAFPKIVHGLTRYINRTGMAEAKQRAHRIECFSLSTYTEMQQWVEVFGLKPEATLRGYGKNGEDFTVYAWHKPKE